MELAFANAMQQLDAGDSNGSVAKAFEPEHHVHPGFDVTMVMLDQVVQTLRGSQFRPLGKQPVRFSRPVATTR
jgi:hypothetical protein